MLAKRVIPCLDCDLAIAQGRVVKGIEFKKIKYAGIPWKLAKRYEKQGADELVFLDITASYERRETMKEIVKKTAQEVFIPLTVGGGIRNIRQATEIFKAGADKISINTSAVKNPKLITKLAKEFGSQACVIAIDAKRRYIKKALEDKEIIDTKEGKCWFECSIYGGRVFTKLDALKWCKEVVSLGAGEILLTSMDRDGTRKGYDLELTEAVCERVSIPVIASGGCGKLEHFLEVFKKTKASAALAASIFHYNEYTVKEIKEYLEKHGVEVRL